MKAVKRFLSVLLSLCLVLGLLPGTAFADGGNLPFADVNTTDWYYDAVQYAYEKGMMSGTSTTAFSPDGTTTRGMIVTTLHRMEGTPVATGTVFTDIPSGQWYSDAVSWASATGIVGGYGNGLFGPDDPITREQMAAILNRYSTHKGYDTVAAGSIVGFSDASQVNSYAVDSMGWAIGNGLISGVGNNTLAPKGNATRAQVATILMRFCENIADKSNSTPAPDMTAPGTDVDKVNKIYKVTFDLNYRSDTQYDVKTVKEGETVSKPSNPSRSGYSFSGWYTEKSGGKQFDFKTGITSDLTLYAHWSSNGDGGNSGNGEWNRPVEDRPMRPPVYEAPATGEELVRAAKIASQNLHSIEEPFRDAEGHVKKEDWPELLEKLDTWGKQAKAEGKLLDYASSKDDYSVTIQDTTGLVMCYVPPILELEAYAGSVQTYEPFYGVDKDFEEAKKRYGTIDQAAEKIKALGYNFNANADGKDVNFDTLKQWKPDGVILWQSHGMNVVGGSFGALITTMRLEDYREEYAMYNANRPIKDQLVAIDDDMNIAVTPNFFDRFYQDGTSLKGSMIWLGCCYSAYRDGFASVFQKKGASLTIGSPDMVNIGYVVNLADKFADALTSKGGTKYSAREALERAKKLVKLPNGSSDMIAQGDDFRLNATTEPATVSLSGVIRNDVSKETVKGAVVAINGVNQATTDSLGKFTVKVPKDQATFSVKVACIGYEDYEAIVFPNKVQNGWLIALTPAGKGTVALPIRLEPNQGKVTNGTVAVYELTRNEDGSIQGINGTGDFVNKKLIKNVRFRGDSFEISGLEWQNAYSLEIAPEGYSIEKLVFDCLSLDNPDNPEAVVVKVTALPSRSFTLTVTDLRSENAISGASVTLFVLEGIDLEYWTQVDSGFTDEKGVYQTTVDARHTEFRAEVSMKGYIDGAVETTETTTSLSLSKDPGQGVEIPEGYTPIYTAKDLEAMNGEGQCILMNDIQIVSRSQYIQLWNGVLDGNGHSIVLRSWSGVDVPNWIGKNTGILRNITFENLYLYSTGGRSNSASCALVGWNSGTIESCEIASGCIVSDADDAKTAGFVNYNDTSGIIRNCINRAEIKATASGSQSRMAGACGIAYTNQGIIEDCTNHGSVYANYNNIVAWGVQHIPVAGITCRNNGTVTGCSNQGALSGYNHSGDVKISEICPED